MFLSKNKKIGIEKSRNFKKSFIKIKITKFILLLNAPINRTRLQEIEEERTPIQFYGQFIK